ncbi:rhodanese-like domain-containing protein [Sulfurimonas lithotrophica]|uniref:Rhodanese-like domain-containing protein n=1 Tax=Sulfurimonas lithotrophica TaxID=2590022 RepID=A0A5P8P330_9BACT|nr:rhodanese-like domain-containing protein [Sulfurimonas lithotrophica]QFR50085.1 rhodanese-like domain-containing protein [Sulfurimonas lithotrophica]
METLKDSAHLDLEELAQRRAEVYLSEQFKKLISDAEKNVQQIEPKDLDLNDLDILLLDVREPEEFASGYLRKEKHLTIPRGKLEFVAIKKIFEQYGHDVPIVTYCFKGPRGLLAAEQLKKMGFTNVKNIKDGLINWLESGRTLKSYFGEITLVAKKS